MDLSVIVPIYNVGEFLHECLDSLVAQEGVDFEGILVDDGSTDNSGLIADAYADKYDFLTCYHKVNGGLSDARNYGIERARGDYITFLDSDDILMPGIYEAMVATIKRDNSDIVACDVARMNSKRTWPSSLHRFAFHNIPPITCLEESPQLVYDTTSVNKLYRSKFFKEDGWKFPKGLLYEDIAVTVPLYRVAKKVSVLPIYGYLWRSREGGNASITQQGSNIRNLESRIAVMEIVNRFFAEEPPSNKVLDTWNVKCLEVDCAIFIRKLFDMDEDTRGTAIDLLRGYMESTTNLDLLDQVPAIRRAMIECVLQNDLERLKAVLDFQTDYVHCEVFEDGNRLMAAVPDFIHASSRTDITRETMPRDAKTAFSNCATRSGSLDLVGALYWKRIDMPEGTQTLAASLVNKVTGQRIPVHIESTVLGWMDTRFGNIASPLTGEVRHYETAGYGFKIRVDENHLRHVAREERGTWLVRIDYENRFCKGYELLKNPIGLAGDRIGYASIIGGYHVSISRTAAGEVTLTFERIGAEIVGIKRQADTVELMASGRQLEGSFILSPEPAKSLSTRRGGPEPVEVTAIASDTFALPASMESNLVYQLQARTAQNGSNRPITRDKRLFSVLACQQWVYSINSLKNWCVRVQKHDSALFAASDASIEESTLRLGVIAHTSKSCTPPKTIELCVEDASNHTHEVLGSAQCKEADSDPAQKGAYQFEIDLTDRDFYKNLYQSDRPLLLRTTDAASGEHTHYSLYATGRCNLSYDLDTVGIRILRNDETGMLLLRSIRRWPKGLESASVRLSKMESLYEEYRKEPLQENLVLFESMWGSKYSCNPRALYEYIDANHPEIECVWSLTDERTPILGSGRRVRRFSAEYFHCLATAKYLVNNVNFHAHYIKREGQIEIQTMHGTPLKTVGLESKGDFQTQHDIDVFKQKCARYDYLVVQGRFMESKAFDAYNFEKEFLRTGYPRTDALMSATSRETAAIKQRLGIPDGKKVLLYAPTWRRQNRFDMQLDIERFARELGDEWVLIVKVHHLAAKGYERVNIHDKVVDCTDYYSIEDLYLISDALITDYSSAMFDYALLDRPILFYTYDLDEYLSKLRDMYFDITSEAPGPLLATNDELIDAVRNIDQVADSFTSQYRTFKEKYLTYENPHSSEMIVREVMGLEKKEFRPLTALAGVLGRFAKLTR